MALVQTDWQTLMADYISGTRSTGPSTGKKFKKDGGLITARNGSATVSVTAFYTDNSIESLSFNADVTLSAAGRTNSPTNVGYTSVVDSSHVGGTD